MPIGNWSPFYDIIFYYENFIKKRWYIFLILLFIIVIFYKQIIGLNKSESEKTYLVKRQTLKETLSLSGSIDAEEKVTLRFQTSGRLAWVGVKEGDYVKKYQAIASLDQRDLKNRLQKYLNTYVKQRLSFEQTKDDYWQKQFDFSEAIRKESERILKQNQYDLESTVLDVEYQNLILENANLWTPIEGIVTRVTVPVAGINITPAQAEFEIVNPKTLFFSVTADQTEVISLKEKQRGTIVFDSYPEDEFEGEIYWISFIPKKEETGTVYQVKIRFDAKNYNFKLGMSGDVNFVIKEKKDVLAIPKTYIKEDSKGGYVNLMVNGKSKKVYIKKGEEIDGKVVIEEGLKEGEIILN